MLFNSNDITLPEQQQHHSQRKTAHVVASGQKQFSQVGWAQLRKHLGVLEEGKYHHFVSKGQWSAINLLEYLLLQSGKAQVWVTTWSISENAIRRFIDLIKSGHVTELKALFDRRVANYNPAALSFAKMHFELKLMPIHAKVIVIKGEKRNFVVNQSANFNDNKRVESGIISTVPEDIDFYIHWIETLLYEQG